MSDALTVDSLLGGGRWFWRVVLATGKGTGLREASYNGGVLRRVGKGAGLREASYNGGVLRRVGEGTGLRGGS